ncbi:MAG TPA: histidine kinase [Bryobacteraceae bacterium]|nr:histidine kinase [Bryobacteraceae bacterium]
MWRRWFFILSVFTAAASLLLMWLGDDLNVRSVLASFVYTMCVGSFCMAAARAIWPRLEGRSRAVRWIGRAVSMGMAVAWGTLLGLTLLTSLGVIRTRSFWGSYWGNLQFAAFITCSLGGVLMVYDHWRRKYEMSELERERALKLATEAQLASLASRIHPHFLFNTLNSISSLIHTDPDRADEQLQRLSGVLRFSLDANAAPLVPLGQEMRMVRDYLDLEKTRFGDRLHFILAVPQELDSCAVPPLSVQTLVENSVKHVIAPIRRGGEVRVTAQRAGGHLLIAVSDGGPGVTEDSLLPGHGLDNLRSRLHVLFAGRARLRFSRDAVSMEVPV